MEFKKKTIIWEPNTEPPKNYYWIKEDNKVYEFSVEERKWVESEELTYTPKEESGSDEPVDPDQPVGPVDPEEPVEPEEPFVPVEYSFTSYADAEGTTEYATGKVETTEETKTFDGVEYTKVNVTENTIPEFVGRSFYIASAAEPGTMYQLYNESGEAEPIWVRFNAPESVAVE